VPTRDGYPEGVPCWADLATTDVESATKFYSRLFGWRFEKLETDSVPYWMAYQKDLAAAGIGPTQGGREFSVWSTYFAVDDADATAAKLRDAGGQIIMAPLDVADAGRMAVAADPTGAVFAIWQARRRKGAAIVNEHGALNWNELQTTDIERAVSFYEAVFGHTHRVVEGGGGPYTLLSVGDREISGVMKPPAPDIPNSWGVYFAVDDAAAALRTAKDAGGSAITDTIDIPGAGILAVLVDPTGAPFTVIQLTIEID
jgi:predicted enzyme related to lactoylglutathione lyase